MGTIEWILGFVAIAALWLFLRAFKKGVRYWAQSSPGHEED
jgi:basic membrane lipoprotein Med (substrate-binding protein (PBP1-ABC) superfamily)